MFPSESRRRQEFATLPPPLPLMFAVAPATATFVRTIAFGDGRRLVGSATANAKVTNGLNLENLSLFTMNKNQSSLP